MAIIFLLIGVVTSWPPGAASGDAAKMLAGISYLY
jgi:hypothetical protein